MEKSTNTLETPYLELKGKTLRIYWHLLTHKKPATVRGLQRILHFSSPSLVLHHLEKLKRMELIQETPEGTYELIKEVKVGLLRFFVKTGRLLLPRYLFYVCFYLTMLVTALILLPWYPTPAFVLLLVVLIFGCITSCVEAFWMWRSRLFYM